MTISLLLVPGRAQTVYLSLIPSFSHHSAADIFSFKIRHSLILQCQPRTHKFFVEGMSTLCQSPLYILIYIIVRAAISVSVIWQCVQKLLTLFPDKGHTINCARSWLWNIKKNGKGVIESKVIA